MQFNRGILFMAYGVLSLILLLVLPVRIWVIFLIAGGLLLGLASVMMRGQTSSNPQRAAKRAGRRGGTQPPA